MQISNLRKQADQILQSSLKAVDPYTLIKQQIRREGDVLILPDHYEVDLSQFKKIYLCGAGKGAAPMIRAFEEILDKNLYNGTVIVKYEHTDKLKKTRLFEAGHPVPDDNTLQATNYLLNSLRDIREKDCVFVLLTGGGSALMESLPSEIKLDDLQKLNKVLLRCSATIHEINCVRKHISKIKGGQLARHIYPAQCVTLALSDVIGDDLSVIASGPTSPDNSTYSEALSIFRKYDIMHNIPTSIVTYIQNGSQGKIPETPDSDDKIFTMVHNLVIGNNRLALNVAQREAQMLGYNTLILTSLLQGEAREIAQVIASIIQEIQATDIPVKKPACLLLGGEPTVKIKGDGKGGRNQELALALALTNIKKSFLFVSSGSDGTDGPTDAAGALVTHETLRRAYEKGLSAADYLSNNNSYNFFDPLGDLIKIGPTRTNVMDIIFALIP
jgi:glycerate 2-kinase